MAVSDDAVARPGLKSVGRLVHHECQNLNCGLFGASCRLPIYRPPLINLKLSFVEMIDIIPFNSTEKPYENRIDLPKHRRRAERYTEKLGEFWSVSSRMDDNLRGFFLAGHKAHLPQKIDRREQSTTRRKMKEIHFYQSRIKRDPSIKSQHPERSRQ